MMIKLSQGTLRSGSGCGSESISDNGEPIPREPMDKFTTSQLGQSTLNSQWKQEERKEVCRKIGRFMYSKGLSFNTVNDIYWFPMMDVVANILFLLKFETISIFESIFYFMNLLWFFVKVGNQHAFFFMILMNCFHVFIYAILFYFILYILKY